MGEIGSLAPPELLADHHDLQGFRCGEDSLDMWLVKRARRNQASGATRTFVVCEGRRVVAYYALAAGAIAHTDVPGRFKREMPNPIPVVLLARLAIDLKWQKQGIGRALVRDAVVRVVGAADEIGIRGILVHALTPEAKAFYEKLGFEASPLAPLTLMISLQDAKAVLG